MASLKKQIKEQKLKIMKKKIMMEEFDPYNDDYEMFSLFSMKLSAKFGCGDRVNGKLLIREIGLLSGAHAFSITWFLIFIIILKCTIPFIAR
jgi:hypothetical protein